MEKIKLLDNQIIQGDCFHLLKQLPDDSIDLILTDPPFYLLTKEYEVGAFIDSHEYWLWYEIIAKNLHRVLKPNHSLLIECSKWHLLETMEILHRYFIYRQPIIVYVNNQMGHRARCGWSHYGITLWYGKGNVKPVKRYRDVIELPMKSSKHEGWTYPNPKLVDYYEKLVLMFSKEHDVVLDPFLGSGTTALACQRTNRRWIGFEVNPQYCEVARMRLNKSEG